MKQVCLTEEWVFYEFTLLTGGEDRTSSCGSWISASEIDPVWSLTIYPALLAPAPRKNYAGKGDQGREIGVVYEVSP
jgi:hypothetical protein